MTNTMTIQEEIYLFPKHMRMGRPTLSYVTKEKLSEKTYYWLNTVHGEANFSAEFNGTKLAYANNSSVAISEEFYEAFITEAAANETQYAIKDNK